MKKLNIDEAQLIKLFNEGKTSKQIGEIMGFKRSVIERRKSILGLKRSNSFYKKKLFNEQYFHNIDSEDKAYWLGFLFADGCVLERNYSKIIRIAVQDKEICDKFLLSINANFQTMTFLEKDVFNPGKKRKVYHVELYSKQMFEDLYNLGCVPRKSLILKFPDVSIFKSPDLIRHFIRGYFDGDGTVTFGEKKNRNKTQTKYYGISFGFNGTLEFLTGLINQVNIGLSIHKEKRRPETNTYYITKQGTNNAKYFYNYIYKDSTVYLERKKNKFEEYFNLIKIETFNEHNSLSRTDKGVL